MILSMSGQAWLFLSTVAAGAVIGFVYDIFRILRKTVPHRHWLVQAEDVLYWLAVTLLMFYFMLHSNYGEIRFFAIAGAAIGALLYFCSLSPPIMKASVSTIEFLKKLILTPIRFAIKKIAPPAKRLARSTNRSIKVMLKKV